MQVTYRTLSRALKIHGNIAKQYVKSTMFGVHITLFLPFRRMLYDFHKWQNGKRPGSVHATYLVYGTKKEEHAGSQPQPNQGDDIDMMSSMPEPEESDDVVPVSTLSLVAEDKLKGSCPPLDPRYFY